jgi:membrane-bound lytic murein transglycosylase A
MLLLVTGCTPKYTSIKEVSKAQLEKLDFDDIEGFHSDDLDLALRVFQKDCARAKRYKIFKQVCQKAQNTDNPKDFFTQNFTPFKLRSKKGNDQGIITGYYEPLLQGSLKETKEFKYPIYKTPKDLIVVDLKKIYPELKKYRLRGRIVGNKLIPYDSRTLMRKKKDLEVIAYVNDKVDLYFLEIQGSGKIELRDGSVMNVGFANQNGHQYESIGKYMIKKGYIGRKSGYSASIQGMKKWFNDNPSKVDKVLNINPSYVFFAQNKQGATGSLGTELTSRRNLAVDRRYIPLGMPVFIHTKNPVTKEKINQLMVAADTGGAIKGEIRADFFWGFAKEAEHYAGRMKEQGQLIMLIPN